jgi:hypothetical protein
MTHGTHTIYELYWWHSRYSKTSRTCTRTGEQAIDNGKNTNYDNIINDSSDLQGYMCGTADKNSRMPEIALVAPIGSLVTQTKEA